MLEEYKNFLSVIHEGWDNTELISLYCAAGITEECYELSQEPDISEQGDVLFYLFMLNKHLYGNYEPTNNDNHTDLSMMSVSIKLQSIVAKYVFHGNKTKFNEVPELINSLYSKTLLCCDNSLDEIVVANMIKLRMRHPDGRFTAYVNKNHEAEKQAIEKMKNGKNKA